MLIGGEEGTGGRGRGWWALMNFQGRELYLQDFMKNTFKTGMGCYTYEPIIFELGVMIDMT